jgi:hypothetical protein
MMCWVLLHHTPTSAGSCTCLRNQAAVRCWHACGVDMAVRPMMLSWAVQGLRCHMLRCRQTSSLVRVGWSVG